MTKLQLQIVNQAGEQKVAKIESDTKEVLMLATGEDFVDLAARHFTYEDGDQIRLTLDQPKQYLVVKFDETLDASLVYVPNQEWIYPISMSDNAIESRADGRFMSERHYLSARVATKEEIQSYRNWALNPHDGKEFHGAYPHAHANVETRNDATFFACNAIDGVYANLSHGSYPYQSWGINQNLDAALTIDFGREIEIDQVAFTLRADFPHDSYWTQVSLTFSDGTKEVFQTKKTPARQVFGIAKRKVTSVTFCELIQAEDESPFPALTQIEVFGKNV